MHVNAGNVGVRQLLLTTYMAKSIVLELQELASDGDHSINELLRKTLMVATKLEVVEFRQWVLAELNGYTGDARDKLPAYRFIRGELNLYHPTLGPVAFRALPQKLYEALVVINVTESVSSLEHLLATEEKESVFYDFGPDQEKLLRSLPVESLKRYRATRSVGKNRVIALLEAVRTTILEWTLTLEKNGFMGEGLSFSRERNKQSCTTSTSRTSRVSWGTLKVAPLSPRPTRSRLWPPTSHHLHAVCQKMV